MKVIRAQSGSALVEYVVLLAFVAVIAVLFSPSLDIGMDDDGVFFGKNIFTHIQLIYLNLWDALVHARDAINS